MNTIKNIMNISINFYQLKALYFLCFICSFIPLNKVTAQGKYAINISSSYFNHESGVGVHLIGLGITKQMRNERLSFNLMLLTQLKKTADRADLSKLSLENRLVEGFEFSKYYQLIFTPSYNITHFKSFDLNIEVGFGITNLEEFFESHLVLGIDNNGKPFHDSILQTGTSGFWSLEPALTLDYKINKIWQIYLTPGLLFNTNSSDLIKFKTGIIKAGIRFRL